VHSGRIFTRLFVAFGVIIGVLGMSQLPASAVSQSRSIGTPYGTLTSDAWRGDQTSSGNTYQWDYQVTAKVSGQQSVASIKTTWTGSASLRNGASWQVSIGTSGVSAGAGSSWTNVSQTKYWNNTNGARLATYRTNMVATPKQDYRGGSVGLVNNAYVKFNGDARSWQINASV
jgi:hypothetical protein